jgi:hypothetical protein
MQIKELIVVFTSERLEEEQYHIISVELVYVLIRTLIVWTVVMEHL